MKWSKMAALLSVVVAGSVLAAAPPALATDLRAVTPRITVDPNNPAIDLQALQNQQRRLDYQNQQQRLRQDDRDAGTRDRLDLRVPTMKGTCRTEVFGNRSVTSCN